MPLKNLAIQKALENNWEEAARINESILVEFPHDVETLNRLAFSLLKLGNLKKAREVYKKVLQIDKTNPIALKNLKKISSISTNNIDNTPAKTRSDTPRMDQLFIEEAGKTRIVELKNIADKATLSVLQAGDTVSIVIKRSKVFVQTDNKKYLGMLPDNIGMRLIPFMKGGNSYIGCIKSIDDKAVTVFLKETVRAKRFKNQPSFTSTNYSPTSHTEYDSDR